MDLALCETIRSRSDTMHYCRLRYVCILYIYLLDGFSQFGCFAVFVKAQPNFQFQMNQSFPRNDRETVATENKR